MPLPKPSRLTRWLAVLSLCLVCSTLLVAQGTGGRILGRVADPSGAVLADVKVTATNEATGVSRETATNGNGDYGFPEVPIGTYTLSFDLSGFKTNVRKGITVELNQVVTFNSTLEVGETKEVVEVTSEAPLVDTTSTQLGAVVNNKSVNELPLNTRDTYQFLQLQPGVQSQLGSSGSTFYGSDDPGSVSVNGGRGRANNFSVNGGDANDTFVNGAAVQPTPDAIDEFRVITNTFDAEYGRNSGAVVNVVTKSGTNALHGDVYEYFRNKVLNAQGFLNTTKPQFNQNQFGGTLGGPIKKDRTFFFGSYEGRRIREGLASPVVQLPTPAEVSGDFSAGGQNPAFAGGIDTTGLAPSAAPFLAQALDGRPGCDTALGYSIGSLPHQPNPNVPGNSYIPWTEVFPNVNIPQPCMDPVALNLLQYLPGANLPGSQYEGVPTASTDADQFTFRFDHRVNDRQNISVYYYFNDERDLNPFYNFQAAGANVPGYGTFVKQRFQQWNPSYTWTISNSLVNESRVTYLREGELTFQHPQNTGAVTSFCTGSASAYCFTGVSDSNSGPNSIQGQLGTNPQYGITTGLPSNRTGLPFVDVAGGFNIGNGWEGELPQVGNSFQFVDNLSWLKGNHTLKFGADVQRNRFDQTLYYNVSGNFTFDSSGTNAVSSLDNYPGYFLGLVDTYSQGSAQRENIRNTGLYLFAQDSWKIKSNLTLNYGLRWELDTPLTDALAHVQTFRPGENSKIFPCTIPGIDALGNSSTLAYCPTGLVVPGDPGVPAGLTSTYYKAFAPRIGLAYSPTFDHGFLGKLFGGNGKTSIRTGWGLFYNPMEQLVLEQFGAEPPFGSSPSFYNTFFNTPFIGQYGTVAPNGFNGIITPPRGQDPGWANFSPILMYGDFQPHLRTQYTAQYNFSIQRELAKDLLWQINYVGSQGHRLLASHDINPGDPQTCLDLASLGQGCGPTAEDNTYQFTLLQGQTLHLPSGQILNGAVGGTPIFLAGTRPYSAPNCVTNGPNAGLNCPAQGNPIFTNIFAEDTIATSAYNSLQTMLEKRFSHGLQFQAAYTFSKSLDWASSFEETLNPFDFKKSRALSLFNSKQRFVINYVWDIPVPKYAGVKGKVLDNWQLSGITQFQSGFPIRLQTQDDDELIGSLFFFGTAAPQVNGPLQIQDPKISVPQSNGQFVHYYLNPNQFSDPPLGTFATTPRSICCGPGENQWDVTLMKKVSITEARYFEFRTDIFNLFNRTEFVNPDGNFSDSTFGQVQEVLPPRLVQFALKFYF
ncbi:MAG: carboxypeptidase regulatory-like domain-containing protein [Terriglobales bacterium]